MGRTGDSTAGVRIGLEAEGRWAVGMGIRCWTGLLSSAALQLQGDEPGSLCSQPLSSDAIEAGTRLPDNPSLGQGTQDNSGGDHILNQTQAA